MKAWDTETERFSALAPFPRLVCVSFAAPDGSEGLLHWSSARGAVEELLSGPSVLANAPYDLGVVANQWPELLGLVFEALAQDRVHDVIVRQQLYDIAVGRFGGSRTIYWRDNNGDKHKVGYSLSALHHRLVGAPLKKDEHRLSYGDLRGIDVSSWDEGPREYALEDARATLRVFEAQERLARASEYFVDQFRQVRAAWALKLASAHGFRVCARTLWRTVQRCLQRKDEARGPLLGAHVLRSDGTMCKAAIQRLTFEVLGDLCELTDTGFKRMTSGPYRSVAEFLAETGHQYVKVDAVACQAAAARGSSLHAAYAAYNHADKILSTYAEAFVPGTVVPVHPWFHTLVASGRTSCSNPNIQNLPSEPGIREAITPRAGCVFVGADYDIAELRTLAQACHEIVGFSKLGDVLNRGLDPHLNVAATLFGVSYEEAAARRKRGDEEIDKWRKVAKALNFGIPGGMGAATWCRSVLAQSGVAFEPEQGARYIADWKRSYSEMPAYFKRASEIEKGGGVVRALYSGRVRGGVRYSQALNTPFQGLAADAVKEAMWNVCREQHIVRNSPLYGTRTFNMIHDELLLESPREQAADAAVRLAQVMVETMQKWTPKVRAAATPVVMERWVKGADPEYQDGRLVPVKPPSDIVPEEGEGPCEQEAIDLLHEWLTEDSAQLSLFA